MTLLALIVLLVDLYGIYILYRIYRHSKSIIYVNDKVTAKEVIEALEEIFNDIQDDEDDNKLLNIE